MRMLQGGSAELAVNIQPRTCARYGFQTGTMLSRLKMSRGLNPSEQDRDGADAPLPSDVVPDGLTIQTHSATI